MSGTINMSRDAFEHPLLKDGDRFRAWFWMVSRACWKATKFDINGKLVELQRGQFATSRSTLADAWNWSPSAVERFLARLETEQMIGRETGQGRSIITICNYDKYQFQSDKAGQETEQATGQRSDSDRTAKEEGKNKPIEPSVLVNGGSLDLQGGSGEAVPAKPKIGAAQLDEAFGQWNKAAADRDWPTLRALTDARRKKLASRLKVHGPDGWREALVKAYRSPILSANPPPSWFNFDWIVKNDENLLKVLEGNYNRAASSGFDSRPSSQDYIPKSQHSPEAIEAARQRLLERGEPLA